MTFIKNIGLQMIQSIQGGQQIFEDIFRSNDLSFFNFPVIKRNHQMKELD